jgi:stearoyl-CoA desaturase (delta-9 desaturase)
MERTIARRGVVVPADLEGVSGSADEIMEQALREEAPSRPKWVRRVTARELGFQRRLSVLLTIGPLAGVVFAVAWLWGNGISSLDLGLMIGFYVFAIAGVTVGYHRLFTHRSFEVPKAIRGILAVAGNMAVEGTAIEWSATHRRHHAYADAYGDPHSPHLVERSGFRGVARGLWHAHMGWLFDANGTDASRWAPDLKRDPVLVAVDRRAPMIILASFFLPPIIAFAITGSWAAALTGLLWGSLVRVFLLHHVTWSINSICHFFGKRPFETRDESTNNWPLSVISFGESWHNNHHAFPTSARHGLLRGQLDPSWRVIRTLEQLRLAKHVRLPDAASLARKRRREVVRGLPPGPAAPHLDSAPVPALRSRPRTGQS